MFAETQCQLAYLYFDNRFLSTFMLIRFHYPNSADIALHVVSITVNKVIYKVIHKNKKNVL